MKKKKKPSIENGKEKKKPQLHFNLVIIYASLYGLFILSSLALSIQRQPSLNIVFVLSYLIWK